MSDLSSRHNAIRSMALPPANLANQISPVLVDEKCPVYCYLNGLRSKNSQSTAIRSLNAIAKHLNMNGHQNIDWQKFRSARLSSLVDHLQAKNLSPKTISLYVSVLRGVLEQVYLLGNMTHREYLAICKVNSGTGTRIKKHSVLSRTEFNELMEKINSSKHTPARSARDKAIFQLLVGTGLRRHEVEKVTIDDINGSQLKVIGKGNKERHIPFHPNTTNALKEWALHRGMQKGSLFLPMSKSGKIIYEDEKGEPSKFSGGAIYDLCKYYETVPPHSLRRTFATWLYKNGSGSPVKVISQLLGHSSTATTELYLLESESEMQSNIFEHLFDD
jgi:integrase